MAFLISLGVQITPQLLSIVSLTIMPMLKTFMASKLSFLRYITIFIINYIDYIQVVLKCLMRSVINEFIQIDNKETLKIKHSLNMKSNNAKLFEY